MSDLDLVRQIDETEDDDEVVKEAESSPGPDAAIEDQFAKQPFRVVYQTNNFLLPQIKDLITNGDDVNLRPEYAVDVVLDYIMLFEATAESIKNVLDKTTKHWL